MEGASRSRFFSQFRRGDDATDRFPRSEPLPRAEDGLELDAFDLALLAQSNHAPKSNPLRPTASGAETLLPPFQVRSSRNDAPKQHSPFFQTQSQKTPLRGLGSSSSELEHGYLSSPLNRFQPTRTPAYLSQEDFGTRTDYNGSLETQSTQYEELSHFQPPKLSPGPRQNDIGFFKDIPISIRGINLVSVNELPDRFRSMFNFPLFNAIQSKCFRTIYNTDDNLVLAAPTGSGKTVVMELAICRLLKSSKDESFKVVYQAPTKSLCAERFRDWSPKFTTLGLQCAELTGDTDHLQLRCVQNSQIIITTPEKWDSMTRKWKDHARLMQLVKLFLIDEVHILKEARGATLEAVVSRMKTIVSNVRFVALSATVPNSQDIATWLGRDATNQQLPARREHFGEDFRPVKLQKFVYGYQSNGNDFAFDKFCSAKLPEIITTHSRKKPIMVFCCTRNSSAATAKELARLWTSTYPPARLWKGPSKPIQVHNVDLKATLATGVAFHHAGLDPADRHVIETGFLEGHISIICCTSTLAVGVNLPCHLVIIKNTVGWQDGGCREYSDLEMMQMLGRAGRPQFDDSAVAVILTRKERVDHYQRLVSGSESIESCLHLNLIDHLNAEIGLGNVTNVDSAIRWLAGTFLFVRLRRNPTHYKLKEGANQEDEDDMLRQICEKDIELLQECGLVTSEQPLKSTEFGDAMARYYVRFETMKTLLTLKSQARVSQILSVLAEAEEFREIRLKVGEKSLYKELNRANGVRFPIKVDVALPSHKISLLIQAELGAVDFPDNEQFQKHKFTFQQDKNLVFSHVNRLIRCVVDCQIHLQDSVAVKNALELARSFGARIWDNSPLQMKQIDQIGIVAVRKLAAAGITSIEALELTEAHQIEMILSKNPPFGTKLLARLGEFPKLRVTLKTIRKETKAGNPVRIHFKAEIAFMNEKIPAFFQRRPVYVCFLAETSDGHMVDFRRISAIKLQNAHEVRLCAELKSTTQHIRCYAMCDEIAGTLRSAEIKPDVPVSFFPISHIDAKAGGDSSGKPKMNTSRRRSNDVVRQGQKTQQITDAFDGDDLQFDDFAAVAAAQDTEWFYVVEDTPISSPQRPQVPASHIQRNRNDKGVSIDDDMEQEPIRLENGKWACNHKCRDKTTCKHFCCRDGLDKPPRSSKKRTLSKNGKETGLNQLTLSASITKKDATETGTAKKPSQKVSKGSTQLVFSGKRLSEKLSMSEIQTTESAAQPSSASTRSINASTRDTPNTNVRRQSSSSDYGADSLNDLPSPSLLLPKENPSTSADTTGRGREQASRRSSSGDTGISLNTDWSFTDDPCLLLGSKYSDSISHNQKPESTFPSKDTRTQYPQFQYPRIPNPLLNPDRDLTRNSQSLDPLIQNVSAPETSCGQKRKSLLVDTAAQENKEKKLKRSGSGIQKQGKVDVLAESTTSNITPDGSGVRNVEAAAASKDWEDIDPLLLDEFKDIVNFF